MYFCVFNLPALSENVKTQGREQSPPNLKFHLSPGPAASLPSACVARVGRGSSAPCCFLAQPLSGSDLLGQLLPRFVFLFVSLSSSLTGCQGLHPNSENTICHLGLFSSQCWVIWCLPEVDAGKCNYCLMFLFTF